MEAWGSPNEEDCSMVPLLNEELARENSAKSLRIRTSKEYDWRAPAITLGFVCLESLSLSGISTNLVTYLSSIIHESNTTVAANVTNWTGTSFFSPILGAVLADSFAGNYKTIVFSSIIYLLGMLTVTVSATVQHSESSSSSEAKELILFIGLYLIAFGSGGVKSSLLPLGADQFDDENPTEREKKESFFSWFYFCMNLGAFLSSILIVWIQEYVSWAAGYGIASACMLLAIVAFLIGTPIYRVRRPEGSQLKRIFQEFVASQIKMKDEIAADSSSLNEVQGFHNLAHTDVFRCLEKAATTSTSETKDRNSLSSWTLCKLVTQVEELKVLLRLFPIWLTNILYSVAYAQLYTTFIEQGRALDTTINGRVTIPPASLLAFEILSIMIVVVARSCISHERSLTQLQRMGVGQFLMILTMSMAGALETKRLESAAKGNRISILWQLPQFFVVGCSEVFCYVGQLEFFYDEGPDSLRSVSTAISLLTISLGNYLNSAVVMVVEAVTKKWGRRRWIADDLNEGHLDYFFWFLAGVSFLNFGAYLYFARRYTLKRAVEAPAF
ncbi:Peptide transporter PTR2 [Apostasia shenzhenica]|uniref:Peptide transporter PTR2 n=1 Tax=Apostasia shenzhenica TaxID=1088818 RepID=A0A2I0AJV5_9ASPA|nr:Peptide transporter PTR2 [Apostasia shenzhenica]